MAVTTHTRPETTGTAHPSARSGGSFLDATDHKAVGRLYLVTAAIFAVAGLALAVAASLEASDPAGFSLTTDADQFTQVWSMSRDLLLLGGIVPLIVGLAVYLTPLQVGSPTLVFARGAAASYWVWLVGVGMTIVAYVANGGPGGGRSIMVQLWAVSMIAILAGLVWAMICVATTILGARTEGMTLERVPVSTWSFFVFSLVGLFSLPITIGELVITFMRVRYGDVDITATTGLTGVVGGLTIAPASYWITIPALGIAADIFAVNSGVVLKAYRSLLGLIGLFAVLTYFPALVSFATVRALPLDNGLRVVSILVTPLVVLGIVGAMADSVRRGVFRPRAPMIGALVAALLTLAVTAVNLLAQIEAIMGFLDSLFPDAIDMTNTLILNGTTFHEGVRVMASAAALAAVAAGVGHWGVKIWSRQPAAATTLAAAAASAAGGALWAFGEIAAGFADRPMYPAQPTDSSDLYTTFGFLSVIGAAILAVGALALAVNLISGLLGRGAGGTAPWSGATLEWATDSPPPIGNFVGPPVVRSPYPLLDGELVYANSSTEPTESTDEGEDS